MKFDYNPFIGRLASVQMYLFTSLVMFELNVPYVYPLFALLIYGFSMVNYVFSRTYEECKNNFIWSGFYKKEECMIQDIDATNAQIITLLTFFFPWKSTWSMKLVQALLTVYMVSVYDGGHDLWRHGSIHVVSALAWLLNALLYRNNFMSVAL